MTTRINADERHMRIAAGVLLPPLVFGLLVLNSTLWQHVAERCRTVWSIFSHGPVFIFPLLLLATMLLFASLARAVWFVFREVRQYRQWQQFCAAHDNTERREHGVPYILVDAAQPFALTHGFLHPTIYLSTAFCHALSAAERMGVLYHEAHHRKERDPARLFFWRLLAHVLFFLPLIRTVSRNALTDAESAADRCAVTHGVSSRSILTAMAKMMQGGGSIPMLHSAGFAVRPRMHERLARLHGEPFSRPLPLGSLLATIVFVLVIASPALAFTAHGRSGTDAAMWCSTRSQDADQPQRVLQSTPAIRMHAARTESRGR